MHAKKANLLGFTESELMDFADSIGESKYRGRQMFRWLYERGARDFGSMTDLGRDLRERLSEVASIGQLTLVTRRVSPVDGTTKFLFALPGEEHIETVLIPPASSFADPHDTEEEEEQQRLTLCVSTQAGCPLDCAFCATATMGLRRNLSAGEIVDQVLQVRRITGRKITNIVFMGMGEPMLNYENVFRAVDIMIGGIGIAARRITVSTAGRADKIIRMGRENRKVKLAVSLHSAIDRTRTALMPINKKYNVQTLIAALREYYAAIRRRITYEYIFFDGINDTDEEVDALIALARQVPCKINVIPFHAIDSSRSGTAALRPSPRMEEHVERLRRSNLTVMVRSNAGEDINAACGQLAVRTGHARGRVSFSRIPTLAPGNG
jgi:23S rRNA (adenine2503-C2)-methyltransferase